MSWNFMSISKRFIAFLMLLITFACSEKQVSDSGLFGVSLLEDVEAEEKTSGSIAGTYHMPVGSGEEYTPTTYQYTNSGWYHGNSWDFNKTGTSGSGDCGEPVMAAADGVISSINTSCTSSSSSSCGSGWGNYLVINHDDDSYYSRYAHLTDVFVSSNESVRQGQAIGTIGTTGSSTACHLHFDIEGSSSSSTYRMKFYYYDEASESRKSKEFTDGDSEISYNAGVFEDERDERGGTSVVGTSNPKIASRPDPNGFSKSYEGGSLGDTTIYYEALASDNNGMDQAWLIYGAIGDYYYSCGGPQYCRLDFPIGDRVFYGAYWIQYFRCGYLVETIATGSVSAYSYTCV